MYTFLTQYDSPNYTPADETVATWGRPRTIEKIAIHWWGDPAQNPTFEGVISHLCNPNAGVSAHFVATGTNRRVACLVAPTDASWATLSANPYTISIECDPRCRDEDYDVVGELIAELRVTYGDLPLMRHSDVTNTRCPGNYDLNRLNQVAANKIARAEDPFGMAMNKAPQITREQIASIYLQLLERQYDEGGMQHYLKSGMSLEAIRNDITNSEEYRLLQNQKKAIQDSIDAAAKKRAEEDAARQAEEDAKARAAAEEQSRTSVLTENNSLLKQILALLQGLLNKISSIFK